jgi:hypothetical protein
MFKIDTVDYESRSTEEVLSYVKQLDDSVFPPVKHIKMYYALYLNNELENEDKIYKSFKINQSVRHSKNRIKLKPLLEGIGSMITKRLESVVLDSALIATCERDELTESSDSLQIEAHLLQMQILTDDEDIYDSKYFIHESGELCRIYSAPGINLDHILKIARDSDYIWVCDKGECSLV